MGVLSAGGVGAERAQHSTNAKDPVTAVMNIVPRILSLAPKMGFTGSPAHPQNVAHQLRCTRRYCCNIPPRFLYADIRKIPHQGIAVELPHIEGAPLVLWRSST